MKYLVAAIFLISTALAYPVGENEGEKGVPLVISDYASVAKSDESSEVPSHEQQVPVQSDVSHEHGGVKVENDSHESSEESGSSESGEKPQDQAKPQEAKDKPLLDEKVEHQAQPSEIINSEVSQPAQDPIVIQPEGIPVVPNLASVPQSDFVPSSDAVDQPKSAKIDEPVEPIVPKSVSAKSADPVHELAPAQPEVRHAEPIQEENIPQVPLADVKPEIVAVENPEPEAPALKALPDEQIVQAEVKKDVPVVQSDSNIQAKSADMPELKEAAPEEIKPADEKPIEEPKPLPAELEKSENKIKAALPEEPIGAAEKLADPVPVHDEVAKEVNKPVPEVVADALPLPETENSSAKEESKKEPEPTSLPEKLPEPSASS